MSTSLPFGTAARPVSLDFDIELTELPPQPILAAPPAQDGRAALTQEDAALSRLFRRGGRARPAPVVAAPAAPTQPPVLTPLPAAEATPPTLTPLAPVAAPPVLSAPPQPSSPPVLSAPPALSPDEAEREQEMLSLELELPDFDFVAAPTPPTLEALPPTVSPELATLLAGVAALTTHWAAIVAGSANHYGVLRDGLSLLVARVSALPDRTPQDSGLTTLVDALIHCVDQLRVSGPNPREAEAVQTALATLAATLPHAPHWLPADDARWQADALMLEQAASPVLRTVPMVSEYAPAVVAAAAVLTAVPVAAAALDFPFAFDEAELPAVPLALDPVETAPAPVPPVVSAVPTLAAAEPVLPTLTAVPVAEVAEMADVAAFAEHATETITPAPVAPMLTTAEPEAALDFPFAFDGTDALLMEATPAAPAAAPQPPVVSAVPTLAAAEPVLPTLTAVPVAEVAEMADVAAFAKHAAETITPAPIAPMLTTAEPEAALDFPFAFDGTDALLTEAAPAAAPLPPVVSAVPTLAIAEPVLPTLTAVPVAEVAEMADVAAFAEHAAETITPPTLAIEQPPVAAAEPLPAAPAEDVFAALAHAVAEEAEAEVTVPVAEVVPTLAAPSAVEDAPMLSALEVLLSGAMPPPPETAAEAVPESVPEPVVEPIPAVSAALLDDWMMPSLDTRPEASSEMLLVAAQPLPVDTKEAMLAEPAPEPVADTEEDARFDFAADSPLELFNTPPQWAALPPPFTPLPAAPKAVDAAPLVPALGAAAFLVVEPTSAAESLAATDLDPAAAWRMATTPAEAAALAEAEADVAVPAPIPAPVSRSILVDAIPHVREQQNGDPLGHDLLAQAETWGQPDSYTPSAIPGAILVEDIPLLRRPMRLEEMEKAEEIAAAAAAASKTGSSSAPVTLPPTALAALFGLLNAEAPPPEPGIDRAAFLLQGPLLIQKLTTERIAARLHGIGPSFITAAEELARCAAEAGYPALAELAAAFAKALADPHRAERAFELAIDVIAVLSDGIQLVRANQTPEAAPDLVAALRAGR